MKARVLIFFLLLTSVNAFATDYQRRLGIGMSNQLANGLPAISMKLQKNQTFAVGGLFALSTDDDSGGYGAGIKAYRILFDEPQLNFYGSALGAMIKQKQGLTSTSGFQFDFTLGSEFHFQGLSSLGFSFEFGLSLNKMDDFVFETAGYHFITAGVHFYL